MVRIENIIPLDSESLLCREVHVSDTSICKIEQTSNSSLKTHGAATPPPPTRIT